MSISHKLIAWLEERLNLTEIFSIITTFGLSHGTIDINRPFLDASREAFTLRFPPYACWSYVLGVLPFLLFIFQALTGLLLAFYFQPSPETAYESTLLIIRDAKFGWYVHQMHYWGSHILITLLAARLVRFFVHGVYKKLRELVWVFGVILFFISTQAALTGTLLPWDQQSYWSVTRGLELIDTLPIIGSVLSFLIGGLEISTATLIRFYVLHIIFLPVLMMVCFYLHFQSVRRVGLSPLPGEKTAEARPIYPDYLLQLIILVLLLFGVVATLGTIFPSPFWVKADPFTSPKGIRPPWYLLPAFGLVELLPHWVAGVILVLIPLGLVLLPFIERGPDRGLRKKPILMMTAAAFCVLLVTLTYIGYRRGG